MNRKRSGTVRKSGPRRSQKSAPTKRAAASVSGITAGTLQREADLRRLLHELQVHQVELEVQNAELQDARSRMEVLLEKYTDLFDFAPVGYFSLDETGRIIEVNLTGATLLGVERRGLMNQRLMRFVSAASQPAVSAFLGRMFSTSGKQVCEAELTRQNAPSFLASLHGSSTGISGGQRLCRIAVSDITALKQATETQRRMEVMALANQNLRREIIRRRSVERALKKSQNQSGKLLEQSRQMQERLRLLSRDVLLAQEEERKKISRELHDVIAQTLAGINVGLTNLQREAALGGTDIERSIARTQHMVEHSVSIVHRFARELRPTVLDDLGLIPALQSFTKAFREETGLQVRLSAAPTIEDITAGCRTVLYRVAQEALTNVARHANATTVRVNIRKLRDAVCMRIKDNGKGFREDLARHVRKNKRLGLLGMKERLEMVGGSFAIFSKPGAGTTIEALIPLRRKHTGECSRPLCRTQLSES